MATSTTTSGLGTLKPPARAALIGLSPEEVVVLRDCLQQCKIQSVPLTGIVEPRLAREKFEAIIVRLGEEANRVLETVRNSSENRRAVVYALATDIAQALPFTRHGINALILEPVEREAALRVLQATQALVTGQMRLYVRVPLVTDVRLEAGGTRHSACSEEISGGGMSLSTDARLAIPDAVEVAFSLPKVPNLSMKGMVSWVKEAENMVGIRFAPSEQRQRVKKWIEEYLDITPT